MATDASQLTFSAADTGDWATAPGEVDAALDELGSRAQRAVFDAYDDVGGDSVTAPFYTVASLTERTNTDTSIFSLDAGALNSDLLTVNQAGGGIIDISYRMTIGNTAADDYGFNVFLARSTDGGVSFSNVAGSILKSGKGT